MRVFVVVLGDLARSPRMVNHAHALAARGVEVDLIGYGASLPQATRAEPRISCHLLHDTKSRRSDDAGGARGRAARLGWLATSAVRAVLGAWRLLVLLMRLPRPEVILVQTPPALPTLAIALIAARLRAARLVVDWHNLTGSLVALRLGERHTIVRLVTWYERTCGRWATAGLAVSEAMQRRLSAWGLRRVAVMRDRPGEMFQPQPAPVRNALQLKIFGAAHPRLVAVSSSWTADDDFELLLSALDRCEILIAGREADRPGRKFPSVAVALTGDGPLRARFQPRFEQRAGRRIHARTIWLSAEDYAALIGSADLGISVHRSSSGIDLPMKICDLFGGGVPVCALDYGPCLSELVSDGRNGRLFHTPDELAALLVDLLDDAPSSIARLDDLRRGATASGAVRWREGWTEDAWPVLSAAAGA